MSFGTAIKTCFKKYADFNGRARRSEMWWFMLFLQLVSIPVAVVAVIVISVAMAATLTSVEYGDPSMAGLGVIGLVYLGMFVVMLPFILPSYAVQVRRLHDTGQSGLWVLLNFVGAGIVPLIMCVLDSQPGDNQWGPNPKGQDAYLGYPPQAPPPA